VGDTQTRQSDIQTDQWYNKPIFNFRKQAKNRNPARAADTGTDTTIRYLPRPQRLRSSSFSSILWRHAVPDTCRLAWQEKQVEIVAWRQASRSGVHLHVTSLSFPKLLRSSHAFINLGNHLAFTGKTKNRVQHFGRKTSWNKNYMGDTK
jgi:hypothetical protein